MRPRITMLVILLSASPAILADNGIPLLPNQNADQRQWREVSRNMSEYEYEEAYRHNQKIAGKILKNYSTNALKSIGVPKQGITFLGTAAGLAANQKAKFHLNKSKTLALEFKNAIGDNRTLFFGYKLEW